MLNVHLSRLVSAQAQHYGSAVALRYRDYDEGCWKTYSWKAFARRVERSARALVALGVAPQENIAIFSNNMPEYLFVEHGAFAARAVVVPFYATSSGAQASYMINDAGVRVLFVGEQAQYDVIMEVVSLCQTLTHIVLFDPTVQRRADDTLSMTFDEFFALGEGAPLSSALQTAAADADSDIRFVAQSQEALAQEVEQRRSEARFEDVANILYTSGTTGQSKGVLIVHAQYRQAFQAHDAVLDMSEQDITLSFLPFCHVFEGAWTKLCIFKGVQIAINLRPLDVRQSLTEVRPTLMCAVPRFWEKVYQGVLEKIEAASPMQRKLMNLALETGIKVWRDYEAKGLPVPMALKLRHKLLDRSIISRVRKTMGLDRANFLPVAGATIPHEVEEFVHACGLNMIAGYGMTETCATVSCDHPGRSKTPGSIGRALPGVEVRIGENDEIQVRGANVTPGYYKKATATGEMFTPDGWLRTGDAGYLKDGELYITERIKDLFKTSNGKYIAPQLIEGRLTIDRHFDQAIIVADGRKFVAALIVPSQAALDELAQRFALTGSPRASLCRNKLVRDAFAQRIEMLQSELASYERIKRFVLLDEPFTMANGLLTNTLKIKRREVYAYHAAKIEELYRE